MFIPWKYSSRAYPAHIFPNFPLMGLLAYWFWRGFCRSLDKSIDSTLTGVIASYKWAITTCQKGLDLVQLKEWHDPHT